MNGTKPNNVKINNDDNKQDEKEKKRDRKFPNKRIS